MNTTGGFEPGGHNAPLRPVVLRATAENFAAGAAAFSEMTRMGIDGGLTEEDLDLIAEIETWAAHFRMVTLAIQRTLGDPPG